MDREKFVQAMGSLLHLAKPHLVSCTYEVMEHGEEYVKVTCTNGYYYRVNVTGDSLCAIVEDVFDAMSGK